MAKGQIERINRTRSGMVDDLESTRPGGMSGEEEGS